MALNKLLKQEVAYIHFYLIDTFQLVMHMKLISFSVLCKIFNFMKFELKCSYIAIMLSWLKFETLVSANEKK